MTPQWRQQQPVHPHQFLGQSLPQAQKKIICPLHVVFLCFNLNYCLLETSSSNAVARWAIFLSARKAIVNKKVFPSMHMRHCTKEHKEKGGVPKCSKRQRIQSVKLP
jgi:hypothetical protein